MSGLRAAGARRRDKAAPDKTYKLIELLGVFGTSVQDVIRNAITRASQTLKRPDWFEVSEVRGLVKDGRSRSSRSSSRSGFAG